MRSKERYFNVKKASDTLKEILNKISDKTKLSPKIFLLVMLFAAGIAVLALSETTAKEELVSTVAPISENISSREYEEELEMRLISIISSIEGVGETRVMVTLESGGEDVYLNNSDYGENIEPSGENSFEKKDDYVIVEGSSGQGGIVIRRTEPRVRGVAVVCRGAGSETVKAQVIEAVTALLDISSARVSVSKMN